MFFRKYVFGETALYYAECPVEGHGEKTVVGLALYPKDYYVVKENLRLDSLIQVAFTGDESLNDYTRGITMNNRSSVLVRIVRQDADGKGVKTYLSDRKGNDYVHDLSYDGATGVFTVSVRYENNTDRTRTLEYLASLSLSGICSLANGGTSCAPLTLHRMTSAWSRECRLQSLSFCDLGIEHSWARHGAKVERWGQVGSMANRGYYPFAAVEDADAQAVWGVTAETPYSWQFQIFGEKESATLCAGLADYEFGHWRKEIPAGGSFQTHNAFFTLKSTFTGVCNAFLHEADSRLSLPAREETMPVLFNEYCTTWGTPSEEKILELLENIKDLPVEVFVIDAGWFKPRSADWSLAGGDWNESKELFPHGIKAVADQIKERGMVAGIWFEFETASRDSEFFQKEEYLLKGGGTVLTSKNRRFLDLRKTEVKEYLDKKVLTFLKEKGFGYLKIDYNDAYGMGCDGAESLGEGGRQVAEESIAYLDKLKETDGLIIENCASGGSRIEPYRMSKVAMCSFSDAHECAEIPFVAANVSRVVPARQIQIWAVLREGDSVSRIVYSLCAAMLGRICLSGDVTRLNDTQRETLKQGLAFYERIKETVKKGDILSIDCNVKSYRELCGRQIYVKEYNGKKIVIAHFAAESAEEIPVGNYRLIGAYTDLKYRKEGGKLFVEGKPLTAGAFLLAKK